LRQGVIRGVEVDNTAATEIVKFLGQQRSFEWVRLNSSNLDVPVGTPSDAELETYHSENESLYTLPETREITYAHVTEDMLLDQVTVTEESLVELFEERSLEFNAPARRILAEAREMLFGTEELGVYGPLETPLGPAIYRVNAVLDATNITLEDVRDELRQELAQSEAAARISEETDAIDDLIAGGASIEDVAKETFMELGTITLTAQTEEGIAADQSFREEALTAGLEEERDLANLSDGLFVLRVDEIRDPTLQPLADVRADVEAAWRETETINRLTELGSSLKERIDGGETLAALSSELGMVLVEEEPLGRNDIVEDTPPAFVQEIFTAQVNEAVVVPDEASVLLARISDIVPTALVGDEVDAQLTAVEEQIEVSTATDMLTYFTQGLQDEAGISVNQSLIQNVLSQLSAGGGHGGQY